MPTATNTPAPTATNTPVPTATNTPVPTPSGFCVLVGPGTYWLFPDNRFLSGLITVYSGSDCEELDSTQASIGEDGYVYTAAGQATAMDLCASGHGDGSTYNVVPVPANIDVWQCALPPTNTPVPTQTNTPLPAATNTALPTATNTSVPPTNTSVPPTNTPVQVANSRAVTNVQLRSNHPGELTVSWNAPSESRSRDYRVMYAPIDEDFKTWSDASGNAFPSAASITFTGLDQGVSYKVKVRARYNGSSGDWSGQVETLVMAEPTAEHISPEQQAAEPPTNTPIPPTNTSVPPPIPPTNTPVPPTNTPIPPTNTSCTADQHTNTTDQYTDSTNQYSGAADQHTNTTDQHADSTNQHPGAAEQHASSRRRSQVDQRLARGQ